MKKVDRDLFAPVGNRKKTEKCPTIATHLLIPLHSVIQFGSTNVEQARNWESGLL